MSRAYHVNVTMSVVSMETAALTMTRSAGVAEVRKLQIVSNNNLAILAPTEVQEATVRLFFHLKLPIFIFLMAGGFKLGYPKAEK